VNATFRNVISANNGDGIAIQGTGATGNAVQNNYIGTTVNGLAALGNGGRGILIGGAGNNSIGGNTAGLGNVVSGNGFGVVPSASGIELSGCTAINTVQGNFVGTDNTGNNALPNAARGVFINGSANQQIGGSTAAARNFISGNTAAGVLIGGAASSGNQVQGNYIGLKATMAAALPNSVGVAISGAPDNIVGGGTPQHGNVISGNGAAGVPGHGVDISLAASTGNNVMSNLIGTNAAGTGAIPNRDDGVNISLGAHDNVIGGTGAGNIISKNGALPNLGGGNGVHITGAGTNGNLILGNSIGLPFTGSSPLGNLLDGVRISAGAEFNQIGGTLMSHRNVIGNNAIDGVKISGAAHNEVRNNLIGQDASGVDQPNTGHGVRLIAAAFDNTIVGNGIYANLGSGVFIEDPGTDQNEVLQNFIGAAAHGNKLDGVHIGNVAKNNVITVNNIGNNGTPGPGFEATGNGIHLEDAGTSGNLITANQVLGNLGPGVFISDEADLNVIGGDTPAAANVIDGNLQHGVRVLLGYDNSIRGNVVRFNNFSGVTVVDGTGNEISRNSIFSNNLLGLESGLGIDLSPSGVTANDAGDGDAGPNNLQNCPVLASAIGGTVSGMLESLGDRTFRIEFFSNAECDASGSGEGRTFIGSMNVTTDAGGAAEFAFDAPTGLPPDEFITATATDLTPNPIGPSNNTSEFSTCAAVMPAPSQAPCDLNCDGGISGLDVAAFTLAVLDPAGYAAQFPGCDILNGDCNDDTATGLPDASGFVLCLLAADSTGVCPP
jgi:titin